jgi:hypothetical protein
VLLWSGNLPTDSSNGDRYECSPSLEITNFLPYPETCTIGESLIDWAAAPDDPIFRLNLPQPGMLAPSDLARMVGLVKSGASAAHVRAAANDIRRRLNPHPAGQLDLNQARLNDGAPIPGLQHKYAETLLVFPRQGQTCHAYCTYCFRWPQFIGEKDLKIATQDNVATVLYLPAHPEVTNVLITGGDALIMSTEVLCRQVESLLDLEHIESIRIGTKALGYWPHRFVTDHDAPAHATRRLSGGHSLHTTTRLLHG